MAKGKVGLGRRGESLAAAALQQQAFSIVDQNWYCREGETDLIAKRADQWYFFEVRTRRGQRYGRPEDSITPRKIARMEAVARHYLGEHLSDREVAWHLGFIAVEMDYRGKLVRLTVYPDVNGAPLPTNFADQV